MGTKLTAPEGVTGITHNGVAIELDDAGCVEVSNNPELVAALKSHGFAEEVAQETGKAKKSRRAAE